MKYTINCEKVLRLFFEIVFYKDKFAIKPLMSKKCLKIKSYLLTVYPFGKK